ncbi:hypothetical protein [Brucella thiophenivorans]|uniref:hypothetical protein n=1 Tax=Brucella thiophenivorans TaxID=571255 RepID=UPI000B98126A|nr:hypothetical protein [Brucella thiophenivorans]
MTEVHRNLTRKPLLFIKAVALLLVCASAISIEILSLSYGYGSSEFDLMTELNIGDLTFLEMMCEFTLPVTFIIGVFMAARGISGWLLLYSKHSVNFAEVV